MINLRAEINDNFSKKINDLFEEITHKPLLVKHNKPEHQSGWHGWRNSFPLSLNKRIRESCVVICPLHSSGNAN